jgi:molybdenum transport protein
MSLDLPTPPCCLDDAALLDLLREDAPHGDLTSHALGLTLDRDAPLGTMIFKARGAQVVSCSEDAARLITLAGATVDLSALSGQALPDGGLILTARGPAGALLKAWKVAQTLLEYTAGIASTTAAIVAASRRVDGSGPVVACTRKTFPGTRTLAAKAVRDGGGVMHRLGLSEHMAFVPMAKAIARLRRDLPEKRVVVEVSTVQAACAAAAAGADVVQLEKFLPEHVDDVCTWVRAQAPACVVAAAGGVKPDNAQAYAEAGAQVLVTSFPYFAPPRDVKVTISAL